MERVRGRGCCVLGGSVVGLGGVGSFFGRVRFGVRGVRDFFVCDWGWVIGTSYRTFVLGWGWGVGSSPAPLVFGIVVV